MHRPWVRIGKTNSIEAIVRHGILRQSRFRSRHPAWRDMYRLEMGCQIIHDSLHSRKGWTESYLLSAGGVPVGYGSVAVGGPWKGKPTVFEWYVVPQHRLRLFDLFHALLKASGAATIETQSNDLLLTVMLHTFAPSVTSDSVLFHDRLPN